MTGESKYKFGKKFHGKPVADKEKEYSYNGFRQKIGAFVKPKKYWKRVDILAKAKSDDVAYDLDDKEHYIKINEAHHINQTDDKGKYINRKLVELTDDEKKHAEEVYVAVMNALEDAALNVPDQGCDTLWKLLRKLDQRYKPFTFSGRAAALKKLMGMTWNVKEGETASDFADRVKQVVGDEIGGSLTLSELVAIGIIGGFPKEPHWNERATNFMLRSEVPSADELAKTMTEVQTHLEHTYDRSTAFATDADMDDVKELVNKQNKLIKQQANMIKQLGGNVKAVSQGLKEVDSEMAAMGETKGGGKGFQGSCHYCGQKGHTKLMCSKRKADVAAGKQEALMPGESLPKKKVIKAGAKVSPKRRFWPMKKKQ